METYNIKDIWVCIECGRFGYSDFSRFRSHTKRIGISALCNGKVVRFETYLRKVKK